MITDKELEFSNSQALTATAASTNAIDLGYADADAGTGETTYIVVNSEANLGGTTPSVQVQVQSSNTEGSGYTTVVESAALTGFDEGEYIVIAVPKTAGRYLRLNYVLAGTNPTATVSAGIVQGEQAWKSYPDALARVPS